MTSDVMQFDTGCLTRIFSLLSENDDSLLEQVKQLREEIEYIDEYAQQLRDEFDKVYEALNEANATISGFRMALRFMKYQQSNPVMPEIDRRAWNVLALMIGGDGEEFLPLFPVTGIPTEPPIEKPDTNGVEYGDGNLKVTRLNL